MRKVATHAIRPGKMRTINNMIPGYCMVLDGVLNKATHVKEDVTCKRCLALKKREDQQKETRNK